VRGERRGNIARCHSIKILGWSIVALRQKLRFIDKGGIGRVMGGAIGIKLESTLILVTRKMLENLRGGGG